MVRYVAYKKQGKLLKHNETSDQAGETLHLLFLSAKLHLFSRSSIFLSKIGINITKNSNIFTKLFSIHSTLEDSSILPFFFRFSLLMLCICCKVRD